MKEASPEIFSAVADTIRAVFRVPAANSVTRTTTANQIDGWDSVSHTLLILALERRFDVRFPADKMYAANNTGELADILRELLERST
jgi:acyl carrier protein